MEKIEYIRHLHNAAYMANLADSERKADWQTPDMANVHVQALLDIVESVLTPSQYEAFLNHFGDFESFVAYMEKQTGLYGLWHRDSEGNETLCETEANGTLYYDYAFRDKTAAESYAARCTLRYLKGGFFGTYFAAPIPNGVEAQMFWESE